MSHAERPAWDNLETTIKSIEDAGWVIESNGYRTYFRHKTSRAVCPLPKWVTELIDMTSRNAAQEALQNVRRALEI